jgi:hypothetical protein
MSEGIMNKNRVFQILSLFIALSVSLACGIGGAASTPRQPTVPLAPISLGNDLTQIDVCKLIPREDIEAVMGAKLRAAPTPTVHDEIAGESGCSYESTPDSDGNARFGYVVFTPVEAYNSQPLYQDVQVSGLGQEAYFNNGAAARELWVKVNDNVAFVVGFGDVPNEDGCKAIAQLILAALK